MKKNYYPYVPLTKEQVEESRIVVLLDLPWWLSWKAVQLVDELVQK